MTTKTELLRIIREKCIDCSAGQLALVRECHLTGCALHPFRMATDPTPARAGRRLPAGTGADADPGDDDGDHASALASAGWGTDEDYGG